MGLELAPIGVERWSVIRYYFTTTSYLHGVRHLFDVVLACHGFVPVGLAVWERQGV